MLVYLDEALSSIVGTPGLARADFFHHIGDVVVLFAPLAFCSRSTIDAKTQNLQS